MTWQIRNQETAPAILGKARRSQSGIHHRLHVAHRHAAHRRGVIHAVNHVVEHPVSQTRAELKAAGQKTGMVATIEIIVTIATTNIDLSHRDRGISRGTKTVAINHSDPAQNGHLMNLGRMKIMI